MRAAGSNGMCVEGSAAQRWGGRVPIIIGAIGQRNTNLNDERLIDALRKQCQTLRKDYKHSPFVILSALTDHSDRLIAQIAMEELSADLIAVLPMPIEVYEQDFAEEVSKTEFQALLDKALYVRTAPIPAGDAWKAESELRRVQYARAGAIVIEHAQILLAIWEGGPGSAPGETADQVRWFECGYPPSEYSLYWDALSPLHLHEPGRSIRIAPVTGEVSIWESSRSTARLETDKKSDIALVLKKTNDFNGAVKSFGGTIERSGRIGTKDPNNEFIIIDFVYCATDALSIYFARIVRSTDALLYILALAAVICFNFVADYPLAPWIFRGVTLAMLLLTMRIWLWSMDIRFPEYRSLAEALRTLFFWRSAGIMRPLWPRFLSRQSGAVHWIRQAARTVEFCQDCHSLSHTAAGVSGGLRHTDKYWIDDQRHWYAGKEQFCFAKYRLWNQVFKLALGATLLVATVLTVLTVMPGSEGLSLWDEFVRPAPYGAYWQAALSLYAAGAIAARGFLRTYLELAKIYSSHRLIFDIAGRMLETVKESPKPEWTATQILERVGEEALQVQSEWLWFKHNRPFEPPK